MLTKGKLAATEVENVAHREEKVPEELDSGL